MNTVYTLSLTAKLLAAGLVAALVWFAFRKGWVGGGSRLQRIGAFLPASASSPRRVARLVEATVLSMAGVMILAVAATTPSTNGYILNLDRLPAEYATVSVVLFICAVLGVGVSILIAILGRTAAAAVVMTIVLSGYGAALNGPRRPGDWFVPKPTGKPAVEFMFDTDGTNVRGAELWINGVRLGTLPYVTTLSELDARVPHWDKPPADFETAQVKSNATYNLDGEGYSLGKQWALLELPPPHMASYWASTSWSSAWETPGQPAVKSYYARVRYAGEWAGQSGGGSMGGPSDGRVDRCSITLSVVFPERQKRLAALLNMARLAGYRVGPEWFKAIETYHEDGWMAVQQAVGKEPRMMEVLDAWATWRYHLDKVGDADSAWSAFAAICDEADARQEYFTASAAGRAVELLVPKLPQERLMGRAAVLIRTCQGIPNYVCWTQRANDRRLNFGHANQGYGVRWNPDYLQSLATMGGQEKSPFPISGFAVAHAVWTLNEQLRAEGRQRGCTDFFGNGAVAAPNPSKGDSPIFVDTNIETVPQQRPNILQRRIVPEIIRSQYNNYSWDLPMKAAIDIGGPELDRFLLRHNWRAKPEQLDWSERTHSGSPDANIWLYWLAYLNDDAGRRFHREHASAMMELADAHFDRNASWDVPREIEFIFLDPWLAKEYWPRFSNRTRSGSIYCPLSKQWGYLAAAGDVATVEMFVEAWQNTNLESSDVGMAFNSFDRLAPQMRQEVVDALVQQIRKHPANVQNLVKNWVPQERLIEMLRQHTSERQLAERLYAELKRGVPAVAEHIFGNVQRWLAHTQPRSPLVAMLANSDKPALRLLVVDVLREFPDPDNQKLLNKLHADPDAAVRAAADKALRELKSFAAEKPGDYCSGGKTTRNRSNYRRQLGQFLVNQNSFDRLILSGSEPSAAMLRID